MTRSLLAASIVGLYSWTLSGTASTTSADFWDAVVLQDRVGQQVALGDGVTTQVQETGIGALGRLYVAKGYRATLCQSASPTAICRRYVGANQDTPTAFTPLLTQVSTIVKVEKALFGFADLHAHPATHTAWGARGGLGFLWGKPGMAHTTNSVGTDLRFCVHQDHSGTVNPASFLARFALLNELDGAHGQYGHPLYTDWPAAHSVSHQQMHVSMLRRAYEGGLRLIVASATDNQMIDIIWNPEFSLSEGRFALREDADEKSAIKQLDFITKFAAANASWMTIAKTAAEARAIVAAGRLAVVLGLEMDELSAEEILKLKATYGVALVIPIHLVNNSFGGTAAYNGLFNVANYVMTGDLVRVEHDPDNETCVDADPDLPCVPFKFQGVPEIPVIGGLIGNIQPRLAEYFNILPGHRNRVGLLDEYGLRRLMKAGLLIDTAHMSSRATTSTLAVAKPFGYPLLHSHGGLRRGNAPSERSLTNTQLGGLMNSGGILGLGTGAGSESDPVSLATWVRRHAEVAAYGPVALGTDLNGMAEQIGATAPLPYPTTQIHDADWSATTTATLPKFSLSITKAFDVFQQGIAHIGMLPDFLAVARQQAAAGRLPPQQTEEDKARVRHFDQIFHSAHDFIATWEKAEVASAGVNSELPPVTVPAVLITIETGVDNLKCGNVAVTAYDRVGTRDVPISPLVWINTGLAAHSTFTMVLPMLNNIQLRDLDKIRFKYWTNQCDPFDTGDTWNIKTLKVTYDIPVNGMRAQGVLMHKRGAPARKLARGSSWTVLTER